MKLKVITVNLLPFLLLSMILVFPGCGNPGDGVAVSPDGVEIKYHKEGEGQPAIVFVHGWSNDQSIWDAQVGHFSTGHTVVTLDLAGFGSSGHNREDWTISAFGEDVAAVVEACGLTDVTLVGFSMGAPVAVEAANKMPDVVTGLVLVEDLKDPHVQFPPEQTAVIDSMMMDLVQNPDINKLRGIFFRKNVEQSFQRVLDMLDGNPMIGWKESLGAYADWYNEQCPEALSRLEIPVRGIHTAMEPVKEEEIRKYIPSYRAHIIPDAGHVIMWDATDEFNRILEESIQAF